MNLKANITKTYMKNYLYKKLSTTWILQRKPKPDNESIGQASQ